MFSLFCYLSSFPIFLLVLSFSCFHFLLFLHFLLSGGFLWGCGLFLLGGLRCHRDVFPEYYSLAFFRFRSIPWICCVFAPVLFWGCCGLWVFGLLVLKRCDFSFDYVCSVLNVRWSIVEIVPPFHFHRVCRCCLVVCVCFFGFCYLFYFVAWQYSLGVVCLWFLFLFLYVFYFFVTFFLGFWRYLFYDL